MQHPKDIAVCMVVNKELWEKLAPIPSDDDHRHAAAVAVVGGSYGSENDLGGEGGGGGYSIGGGCGGGGGAGAGAWGVSDDAATESLIKIKASTMAIRNGARVWVRQLAAYVHTKV